MSGLTQFLMHESGLICSIFLVLGLIVQERLGEQKAAAYGLDPDDAAVLLYKGVRLIDVRDRASYKKSHIERARWQSRSQLEMHPDKILNPQQQYIIYCDTGSVSEELARLLRKKAGYDVYYIASGLESWKNSNLKVINKPKGD